MQFFFFSIHIFLINHRNQKFDYRREKGGQQEQQTCADLWEDRLAAHVHLLSQVNAMPDTKEKEA